MWKEERTYAERLELLDNPEFVESVLANDQTPEVALGLDKLSLADRCSQPVVLTRTPVDERTGVVQFFDAAGKPYQSTLVMPCRSSNADRCASCAHFMKRLRMRQILNTLEPKSGGQVRTALFTLTAPSFGRVHRANWTAKDEWKHRNKPEAERYRARLTKQKLAGPCPCGDHHDEGDDPVGSPIDPATYDYAREVIWSANLANLMKSTQRRIKYLARSAGISVGGRDGTGKPQPNNLRLYAVYERQKRGSLHAHILVVVDGNANEFYQLVRTLGADHWKSPTARIPDAALAWYQSDELQHRLIGADERFSVSIPTAKWKGGEEVPGQVRGGGVSVR